MRGIDGEVDANAPVPGYILTVILPFDGLITYGLAMKVATDYLDPATHAAFAEVERQYGQQGTSVRTARQFLQAAPVPASWSGRPRSRTGVRPSLRRVP